MTDKEMFILCFRAFMAMPQADKARKILKEIGERPGAYAGNGSHILAAEMVKRLRIHLVHETDLPSN